MSLNPKSYYSKRCWWIYSFSFLYCIISGTFGRIRTPDFKSLIFLDAPLPAANPWKKSVSPDPVPVQVGSAASQPGAGAGSSQSGSGPAASKPVPREKKGESVNTGKQVIIVYFRIRFGEIIYLISKT